MSAIGVAIVGANGFIGNHLCNKLKENSLVNLKMFGRSKQQKSNNTPYYNLDLSNPKQIQEWFSDIDIVYYLASDSIPASSWDSPIQDIENNLIPFIKLLDIISLCSVKKVVFTSSAGTIYGSSSTPLSEDSNKTPFSPHGISKLTMEHYLNYYKTRYNLAFDIFRISNVYGEGQDTSKGLGVINTFIESINNTNEVNIYGSGENIRNYIYINDVVEILSYSILNLNSSNTYNLSSNDSLSINELVTLLKEIIKEDFVINYKETRGSDNPIIKLDNSRIQTAFPNFRFTPLSIGIQNTYKFIK